MILNEPIIKVFELQYKEELLQDWHNAYLHTTGAFEYHVTEGYWMLLESENYYVTIGYDGVQKYNKPYVFDEAKFEWWYNGDEEWTDYKDTLLEGQKIHSIEAQDGYQTIYFDAFKLDLYVYGSDDEFNANTGTFGDGKNVMAVGSHLLKKCSCGGNAVILCDERSDFAIRCSTCHKATYFDMILKERIDAWITGDSPCIIDTGYETLKNLLTKAKGIRYLALSSGTHDFEMIDKATCGCANIMIAFDESYFLLSSQKIDGYNFDFTGSTISNYNREFWTNVIKPTESILFVREEQDHEGRKILRFRLDDVDLLIEATCWGLSVSLDEAQLLLNGNNIKRQQLFQ